MSKTSKSLASTASGIRWNRIQKTRCSIGRSQLRPETRNEGHSGADVGVLKIIEGAEPITTQIVFLLIVEPPRGSRADAFREWRPRVNAPSRKQSGNLPSITTAVELQSAIQPSRRPGDKRKDRDEEPFERPNRRHRIRIVHQTVLRDGGSGYGDLSLPLRKPSRAFGIYLYA